MAHNTMSLDAGDVDNDGLMEAGEPVITAAWQGNNQTVTMENGEYDPVNPAGDPLVVAPFSLKLLRVGLHRGASAP